MGDGGSTTGWLGAPTGDGLWWRADALDNVDVVRVSDFAAGEAGFGARIDTMGWDCTETWRGGACVYGAPGPGPHRWLPVAVPEAPQ